MEQRKFFTLILATQLLMMGTFLKFQQKERNFPKAIRTMIFYLQMAMETVSQI